MDIEKQKDTKKKIISKSNFAELIDQAIPSYYVRFHQPVPPGEDKEPVSEFRLESKQSKYLVDMISWTPHGVIFRAHEETGIVPLANIIYCRIS
jgi:hypothetical protein